MIKKFITFLSSVPLILTGGVFLVLSFILNKMSFKIPFDVAWITLFICGLPLLYSAVRKIIYNKGISKISSALLISFAMIAAIIIGDLFAAGEVAFIMALGEILEDLTTSRAKRGLKSLINVTPTQGRIIKDNKETIVNAESICKDDTLRILPGEVIPVDGVIINGETSVDQSIMTGESIPADKIVGDFVFCGTVNCFGSIDIRATKVGKDSSLQKLIHLVEEAENKKAPIARITDKCASWLVPVALLIAIIAGIVTQDVVRAVTVLVVFCPCALVLATPTAIMAAIGQATKQGIIIKSGAALEQMSNADTIVFDKTGTLTYGTLEVCDIFPSSPAISDETILSYAASAESKSEHPIGKAIVNYAKKRGANVYDISSFKMSVGKGVAAKIGERNVFCGNSKFLVDSKIKINDEINNKLTEFHSHGKATVMVAYDDICIGIIALSDTLRPEAAEIVSTLKAMNTNVVLLTGDNGLTANHFSKKVGIVNYNANLLPENKVDCINKMQSNNHKVCMIGDGVNDAPALKTADVSIAMGTIGSDIAIESADIALINDDISKIPYLKKLSKATSKTIKLGIFLSMAINIIAVVLSVIGLLNPTTGALVHNGGSFAVLLIAALLYDKKIK